MRVDQIGLLLWKNYIVRKRQPVIISHTRNESQSHGDLFKSCLHKLGCLGYIGAGIRMAGCRLHDPLHDPRQRGSEVPSNLPIPGEVDAAERAVAVRSEFHLQPRQPLRSSRGIRRSSLLQKRHVSMESLNDFSVEKFYPPSCARVEEEPSGLSRSD